MKKNKIGMTAAVLLAGLTLFSATALAADDLKADSKGQVGFSSADELDENITIPEVTDEDGNVIVITPTPPAVGEEGNIGFATGGGLAIFAPFLDFGSNNAIKETEDILFARPMQYDGVETSDKYYLPPMAVVKDLRGDKNGTWEVTVKSEEVFTTDKNDVLIASMQFSGAKLFNSTKMDAGEVTPDPTDQNVSSDTVNFTFAGTVAKPLVITKDEETLMTSKNGKGAGQTSYVPHMAYEGSDVMQNLQSSAGGTGYKADTKIDGAQLVIPASSIRKTNETYTNTLTWTLKSTP